FTAGSNHEQHGLFGSIQKQTASTAVVKIVDSGGSFAFSPQSLTISVGTTVTWKNTTQVSHTATSDDGTTFDSGIIPSGGTFSFTFTTTGTFGYHCNIHPFMTGTITVI